MTQKQFGKILDKAMKAGAAKMADGSQIVYHKTNDYKYGSYFAAYDKYGQCVDTAYKGFMLYYLYR